MNATDHALIWCGWLKHWVHKEREAGTSDQSPWTPRGLTHEARGLKSASPHPCPGESGRQVPGGGAARSAVRPSLFPPSRAASCASCARAPRIRHHRAGARDRPVLQVGAALRPEGKGLPREPGFRCPRPPSLLLPIRGSWPLPAQLGRDLAAGASAVRPRGTSLPGGSPEPAEGASRSSSCRVDGGDLGAYFCQGARCREHKPPRLQAKVGAVLHWVHPPPPPPPSPCGAARLAP